jgi:hypothetical protein
LPFQVLGVRLQASLLVQSGEGVQLFLDDRAAGRVHRSDPRPTVAHPHHADLSSSDQIAAGWRAASGSSMPTTLASPMGDAIWKTASRAAVARSVPSDMLDALNGIGPPCEHRMRNRTVSLSSYAIRLKPSTSGTMARK